MGHLFLTGFMGAGKSTVGVLVAERLGLPFVDLDRLVEEREGAEVTRIFAESGENAFRCAETGALASLDGSPDSVVACGGGVVLASENRALLRRIGTVVHLAVSAEEALERVGDDSGRPLLAGEAARMATTLLDARRGLYASAADLTVDTGGRAPEQVADEVVRRLRHDRAGGVVRVTTASAAYDVTIGAGLLDSLGAGTRRVSAATDVALVTDENVLELYGARAVASLGAAGFAVRTLAVPAGEASKSWERAGELLERMTAGRLGRDALLVALGGGVVGDLGGFCASVHMRGIPFVQVPTTLLAQVDASVGGKTGVDLAGGKNLAGSFWQPLAVFADVSVLATLPEVEWRGGLAEVSKAAILSGGEDLGMLEAEAGRVLAREPRAVARAVEASVRLKAAIVSADERESGARESLNLGHTLGHAIEKVAGYGSVPHGVAVAEGIRFAARLAEELGAADATWRGRQERLLDAMGLSAARLALDVGDLLGAMRSDKKVRAGRVRFVLSTAPGAWEVREMDEDALRQALDGWAADPAAVEG